MAGADDQKVSGDAVEHDLALVARIERQLFEHTSTSRPTNRRHRQCASLRPAQLQLGGDAPEGDDAALLHRQAAGGGGHDQGKLSV
jgi:hypothetical protein